MDSCNDTGKPVINEKIELKQTFCLDFADIESGLHKRLSLNALSEFYGIETNQEQVSPTSEQSAV